ncbi:MAG: alpha/beta hydrolase fold domain-containing protein [Nitrososphaerales archaeon]
MKAPQFPTVLSIAAIVVISLYSAHTIDGVLTSNAPSMVMFTSGLSYRDVSYCNSQTLDLYLPFVATTHPLPLAIFVHGGGLTMGDKSDINPVFLNTLASAGYAVASLNYRLAPLYKFPAQLLDVKCAIRFLRDNAHIYGVNGSEIFAFGTSAGGQLVALAALTGRNSTFDVGAYLNESSGIVAGVDMFGPANLTSFASYSTPQKIFGNGQNNLVLASPTHYVTPNSPPILIIQGVNDSTVPESQSIQLYNALTTAGDQTQLLLIQNMGHMFVQVGSEPIDPSLAQIANDMVSFFGRFVND